MRSRPITLAVALAAVCLVVSAVAAAPAPSAAVSRALADPAFAGRAADGTIAVWVWFQDKGLQGDALGRALDDAERGLGERAAARRAKTADGRGGRLADVTDLPLHRPYLESALATGARLRRESRWLNAASFDARPEQVRALAALPCVREVTLVRRAQPRPAPAAPGAGMAAPADKDLAWSIDYGGTLADLEQINVPALHEEGVHGQGVLVGMMDSGFRTSHVSLSGLPVLDRWDFVNGDGVVENEPGDPSTQDDHGTKTMSTVGGYDPGNHVGPAWAASFVLAKTEDVSQEVPAEEDNWVAGIEWLDTFGVDVVSSSLGYIDWYSVSDLDGDTAACTIAADLAVGKGIVVCNSAGNERGTSWNSLVTPADGDSVITAGAVTSTGTIAYFSSPGPTADGRIKPDVCALGSGNHVANPSGGYTSASGTSFSCPLTAGVAALVLSRVPSLTPMQVREAMRMTADRAAAPDNDFGWGILDAYAAAHYFGAAIAHAPLGDTEQTTGSYAVACTITDRVALTPSQLLLHWRADAGAWQAVQLAAAGGDAYAAAIPAQADGTVVSYYLTAGDVLGIATALPATAPAAVFSFRVGADVTPPQIAHTPLGDQPLLTWPPLVRATATDNLGLGGVAVTYDWNGVAQPEFPLADQGAGAFQAAFPIDAGSVQIGDVFTYTIVAADGAAVPNTASDGPHAFAVIDALGVALVIDDTATEPGDLKFDQDKRALAAPDPSRAAAADLDRWLREAGYVTDVVDAGAVSAGDFTGKQFVVLTCGANTGPVADAALRTLLQGWAAAGGKLLVEGGEVAYDAVSSPGYPDFAAQVLHAGSWRSDNAGALNLAPGMATHPVATTPHALPASLSLNYVGYGDEDAVDPAADATVIYGTASYAASAGVMVHDDNPAPQAGQIVVLALNVGALADTTAAKHLVENAAAYLMADEGQANAAISGLVWTVAGGAYVPLAGATVDAGAGHTAVTDGSGRYLIADLYAGAYNLTATSAGLSTDVAAVTVGEGQVAEAYFRLVPVAQLTYDNTTPVAIPDNNTTGIVSIIHVGAAGTIAGVDVDLDVTHTWRGDLIVELVSPAGTVVRLHNRSGSSADNIVGNYPGTLAVEGPGALADFVGEAVTGDWTLLISDVAGTDTGTLNGWGLNLTLPTDLTAAPQTPPAAVRLLPNRPNPFNPRTEIRFELARDDAPRLAVYDVRGQLVRELLAGEPLAAGPHAVVWDGRDDAGHEAPSGLYLARLLAEGVRLERKLLLAR
ncbi:MAG: S8 family serine peptidase [bacterium]|nr:S8 family serine peptidase [bacterium]